MVPILDVEASRLARLARPEVIQRLQPRVVFSRAIEGAGDWAVRYGTSGQPAFTVTLLPRLVHVRGVNRLTCLVQLLREEATEPSPAAN